VINGAPNSRSVRVFDSVPPNSATCCWIWSAAGALN